MSDKKGSAPRYPPVVAPAKSPATAAAKPTTTKPPAAAMTKPTTTRPPAAAMTKPTTTKPAAAATKPTAAATKPAAATPTPAVATADYIDEIIDSVPLPAKTAQTITPLDAARARARAVLDAARTQALEAPALAGAQALDALLNVAMEAARSRTSTLTPAQSQALAEALATTQMLIMEQTAALAMERARATQPQPQPQPLAQPPYEEWSNDLRIVNLSGFAESNLLESKDCFSAQEMESFALENYSQRIGALHEAILVDVDIAELSGMRCVVLARLPANPAWPARGSVVTDRMRPNVRAMFSGNPMLGEIIAESIGVYTVGVKMPLIVLVEKTERHGSRVDYINLNRKWSRMRHYLEALSRMGPLPDPQRPRGAK